MFLGPARPAFGERIDRGPARLAVRAGIGVDRDEKVRILVARKADAVFQRHEGVVAPGQGDAIIAPAFQRLAHLQGGIEHDVFLADAGDAYSARVTASVAGVDHDGADAAVAAPALERRGCGHDRPGGGKVKTEFRGAAAAHFLPDQAGWDRQIEHEAGKALGALGIAIATDDARTGALAAHAHAAAGAGNIDHKAVRVGQKERLRRARTIERDS